MSSSAPPASPSAERSVLGAVLVDANCFYRVVDVIGPDDFYTEPHRRIFRAFASLADADCPIDLVTVTDQLQRDGVLVDVGGAGFVASLANDLPDPANVGHYATIVREAAARRRCAVRCGELAALATTDGIEVASLAVGVEALAAELREVRGGGQTGFRRSVDAEVAKLRVRDAAARIVRLECAGALGEAPLTPLADFLAVADEPQCYRLDELWPIGGRVILAAAYKAGKTTLRDNLVRSLVDGESFLGRFAVHAPEGRVVIVDTELDARMLRRWLRDQRIRHTDRVLVLSLRGRLSTFNLLDKDTRARWAGRLREAGASIVILDCLRSALDALGLSEDKDAGRFLVAFDELLAEAGASEAVVIHHAGHGMERSRGDSRLRDWPDAEWRLVREKPEDGGEPEAGARRFFTAFGRDVDVPEGLLDYDPRFRRLTFAGGTRKEAAADGLIPELLDYLAGNPGATGRQIEGALMPPNTRAGVREALRRAIKTRQVVTRPGDRRSVLHTVAPPKCASAPQNAAKSPAHENVSAPVRPIGAHGAHTHGGGEDFSAPTAHIGESSRVVPTVPAGSTGTGTASSAPSRDREPGSDDDLLDLNQ
ncbi:MAG: DnaB-like helicase N-terminal domain-containing protein [Thermoanaerobaculales bacterium]